MRIKHRNRWCVCTICDTVYAITNWKKFKCVKSARCSQESDNLILVSELLKATALSGVMALTSCERGFVQETEDEFFEAIEREIATPL